MIPHIPYPTNLPISPPQARITGWVLIGLGLFLMAFMGGLLAFFLDLFPLSAIFPGTYRDPNAPVVPIGWGVSLFLGFIFSFGLVSFVEGFWRIRYGKPNRKLVMILFVLGNLFIAAGIVAKGLK